MLGKLCAVALSAAFTCASVASAGVAYDSFGPGNSYEDYGVWFGTRQIDPSNTDREATRFEASLSGPLKRITAGMFHNAGTNAFTLTLAADDAGGSPGTTLWSRTFTGKLGGFGSSVVLDNLGGPLLDQGAKYWLIADAVDAQSYHAWYTGKQGAATTNGRFADSTGNTWRIFNVEHGLALRVETPEPTSIAALSLVLLGVRRSRR